MILASSTAALIPTTRDTRGKSDENQLGVSKKKKPSPNKWIKRGSTPLIGPFRCLFGGHWYLMGPYRCRTALDHEPRYHTGPFPGAPTGRVGSQGSAEKGTFGKERKRTVDTR